MTMQATKLIQLTMAAALVLSLGACKTGSKGDQQYAGSGSGTDSDSVNGTPLPDRQDGVSFMSSNVDKTQFKPVHFAFDSYNVDPADQGELDQVADFLKGGSSIIIAGFTDERGTSEYNRGLGERRAESVRQYLIQHGVAGDKIQTVSFGADMPADPASNEAAWAKNRRAEFGVVK